MMPRPEPFLEYTLSRLCAALAPDLLTEAQRRQALARCVVREFPRHYSFHYAAVVVLKGVLDRAVQLVVLGHNAAAYIELHAALERYAIEALPRALAKDQRARAIIADLISRSTLAELAPHFVTLGRWGKTDLSFVRRLARIRNGIAHRNDELLRRVVGGDLSSQTDEPIARVNTLDATKDLVHVVRLMIRTSRFTRKSKPRTTRPIIRARPAT